MGEALLFSQDINDFSASDIKGKKNSNQICRRSRCR